jgi:hypothetical protein
MSYIGNQPFNTSFVNDTFSGNGVTTAFTLSRSAPSPNSLLVTVSGVLQDPLTYGVVGATLTFTQAPVSGTNNISVRFLGLPASNVTNSAYRSVTDITAIAGQTTFPVASYTPGFIDVYRNGVKLGAANFTATNGATVVLSSAAAAGDLIQTISFFVSSVVNALPATAGIISSAFIGAGAINTSQIDVYSANGTGASNTPAGTTAQRPAVALDGARRFNTSTGLNEVSYQGFWFADDQDGYTVVLGKTRQVFQYTGANQTFVVPGGITRIFVKMWGAGGGGGSYGGWRQGSTGGAGGYSEAIVPVVPGQSITVIVGGRGRARPGAERAWPNGGRASTAGGDNQYTANGGASSSIIVPTINSGNPCMYAGGGGGGGSVTGFSRNPGGAGGGLRGEDGYVELTSYTPFTLVGKGGTQTAGGGAGAGGNSTGGAGSANLGGDHQNGNNYGGGGGGGYFGGGSGAYGTGNSMAGGGGGSGFIHSSLLRAQTLTGVREYPPCAHDPDAIEFSVGTSTRIGVGGDEASTGGHGLVVFYY